MDIQIAAKDIKYTFEDSPTFQAVQAIAEKTARELYQEEQEFQKEEYETMLADGDISSYEEYCSEVGIEPWSVDYRKPFEENKGHREIAAQIDELTNKYMRNVLDLPQNAVVTIDDNYLDDKGTPDEEAVRSALKEKFSGINIAGFENAAKAEKKDVLSQNAYEKVGEMIKSSDFQTFLDLRASIEKYSSKNISLIYLQKPDAKSVMGFNAWKKLDRHVEAGQGGISIWQPNKRELRTEQQVDTYIKNNEFEFGKPDSPKALKAKDELMKEIDENGKASVLYGYSLGNVFDISQTASNDPEHDNLKDLVNLDKPLGRDLENYDEIAKSMKDAASLLPFSIPADVSPQDALFNAVADYADRVLNEVPEQVNGIKSNIPLTEDMHRIETMMSAHLICRHIGIECEGKASLKLAEIFHKDNLSEQMVTVGKRNMFSQCFDRACKLSDQFTKEFDKSFGYDLEAQREALKKEAADRQAAREAERAEKAKTRVFFGKTPLQKVDEWEKNGTKYVIAQSEKTSAYYAKSVNSKNRGAVLNGDDGKPMKFDAVPSRDDVEALLDKQPEKKAVKAIEKE